MKLSVPVLITKKAYKKFIKQLSDANYTIHFHDNGSSVWIGDVCIAEEFQGSQYVYPANFNRYT